MYKLNRILKGVFITTIAIVILVFTSTGVSAATAREAINSVVVIEAVSRDGSTGGTGTGFAIGEVGKKVQYVVTNYHVVAPAYESGGTISVCFSLATNDVVRAEVFVTNQNKDLAIIKLPEPTDKRKSLVICPRKKTDIDDSFTALGFPAASSINNLTKLDKSDVVVTKGGIAKEARIGEVECYQVDVNFSEGNSGGPLVNSKGEVVGINSFYIQTQAGEGKAVIQNKYAIVIDELLPMINRDQIPYTIAGEITTLMWIYIGCGAAAFILIILFIILLLKKKTNTKGQGINAEPRSSMPSAPVPNVMPISNALVNASIRGVSGKFANQAFKITNRIVIGRDSNKCSIAFSLDTPGISGVHCEVYKEGDAIYIKDLGSSYGTFLAGGNKLNANTPVKLSNGTMFYLATEENTFEVRM